MMKGVYINCYLMVLPGLEFCLLYGGLQSVLPQLDAVQLGQQRLLHQVGHPVTPDLDQSLLKSR